ncbi:TetR/AcrR family transcriptional regulator [Amycolatopsis sacchari]|uniref:DNA-binding transcriptional regulator, AcrR family n=1 Tax=Amycolatopsis sacchari TaxID=115433 RepID=A0A1I3K2D9_9PSEU|nr:TetR/AcrR family transcriptional regulator [Amycolatopsis sacchari]SFI66681.1 DNA-binding transcriptional regulator, AcrR family [Amycolatopsis sacchari]
MTDSTAPAPERPPGKRQRLVTAAVQLLHRQGIERTTLADIAKAADVPAGNVYYYFKTKNDIIAAVVEAHAQQIKTTLAALDAQHRSPKARLKSLVREFAAQSTVVAQHGCPFGSLCSELDKRVAEPAFAEAELLTLPIDWAEQQFRALGRRDARDLAVELLAAYEGHALLANTLRDPDILTNAARRLTHWIDTL